MKTSTHKFKLFCMLVLGVGLVLNAVEAIAHSQDSAPTTTSSSTTQPLVNEYCPVMPDTKPEPDLWLDFEGQRIYFCHEMCKTKFLKAPQKYLTNLPTAIQHAISEHQQISTPPMQSKLEPSGMAESQHDHDRDHDHAADGEKPSVVRRWGEYLGKFHPAAVHMPIGILLAGALAEILFMFTGKHWLSEAVRFCVLMGAVAAVGTAILGWLDAMGATYGQDLTPVLEYHRWVGSSTAVFAVIVAGLSEYYRRSPTPGRQWAFRVALLLVAVAIAITGHLGGTLVYGLNYYVWS